MQVIYEVCTGAKAYDETTERLLVDEVESHVTKNGDLLDLEHKSVRWNNDTFISLMGLADRCTADKKNGRPLTGLVSANSHPSAPSLI